MMEFHPLADIFPMMDAKRFAALRDDIAEHGLREPITIAGGKIADGRNRYNACVELGIEPLRVEWNGNGDLLAFIVSMNLARRHLNESQRGMVAEKAAQLSKGRPDLLENSSSELLTQSQAATMWNVSVATIKRGKKVAKDGIPELQKAVEVSDEIAGKRISVSLAAQVANWEDEQQVDFVDAVKEGEKPSKALHRIRKEQATTEAQNTPAGTFNVILADPPWPYRNIGVHGAAEPHYPTMALDDICTLLENRQADVDENAVLFLWAPNPQLEDAFKVIDAWGFQYKTNIVWVKTELKKPGSGWYVRGRHELCLICTKGAFTPPDEHISPPIGSVITAPVGEHSEKPSELYEIIERLYPGCSYLELFARHRRDGWEAWGNQV